MNNRQLHQQKLAEIMMALRAHGLPVDNYRIRRLAWLMNFHLTKHKIRLTAYQACNLLKLEIVEGIVKVHGRGYFHTSVPASLC